MSEKEIAETKEIRAELAGSKIRERRHNLTDMFLLAEKTLQLPLMHNDEMVMIGSIRTKAVNLIDKVLTELETLNG